MEISNKLFVEGLNDLRVISALCEWYKVPENFRIITCESVEKVMTHLKLALMDPIKNPRIGIVVDADQSIDNRYKSFVDCLRGSSYYDMDIVNLNESGLVVSPEDGENSIVGAWFMPDNKLNGMLEDFVMGFEGTDNVLMMEADSILKSIEQKGIQKYKDVHRSKAKVHSYLAWQEKPGMPMGQAVTAHVLNPESPKAKLFVDWLNRLFN